MSALSEELTRKHRIQIEVWIREACIDNGLPYVAPFIEWDFNARLTRCAGKARELPSPGHITLSPGIWQKCGERERRNTVKHEACHLITWVLFGKVKDSHGKEWQQCMIRAKEEPDKYHSIYCKDLRKEYIGVCNCGTWILTKQQMKGLIYCNKCNSPVRYTGETTRDK